MPLSSFSLLFVIFCYCGVGVVYSQSIGGTVTGTTTSTTGSKPEVTLWQFGTHRLAWGISTLPVVNMGVASDGLATTFLYEVLVSTSPKKEFSSRTIVASASGWKEHFDNQNPEFIECKFIDEHEGICFDPTTTASGTPLAFSFPIGSTIAPTVTPTPTVPPTPRFSTSASPTNLMTSKLRVGGIVGCVLGGVLAMCLMILTMWILLRQRRRKSLRSESDNLNESKRVSNGSIEVLCPRNSEGRSISPSQSTKQRITMVDSPPPNMPSYDFENHALHRDLRNKEYVEKGKVPYPQSKSSRVLIHETHEESLRHRMDALLERLGKFEERRSHREQVS
ncbi:hypothetical protein D9757_006607 [Collybiopsis confluens]|uniref:Uncharacterized protein n=1 Tax=Collybiopsis confluens TaxID=2823264 RepID=A0A8H5HQD6_9AGAR|nr:hypothetical protein D9757_006607 [Collybiopsis confluens]